MDIVLYKIIFVISSFLGGIIASLSPCSIGLLPLILAYVCGVSQNTNKELLIKLFSFSAGLSSVLGLIGLLCALTGNVFGGFNSPIMLLIFGSIMMTLGLQLAGFLDIQMPALVKSMPKNENTSLFVYPFLIGVLFAFISSPCSSPILVGIMTMAAASSDYVTSFFMLFAFAFGQCLIIILAGLFASFMKKLQKLQKYTEILIKISGWIFIIFALMLWYSVFKNFFNY